MAGMLPQIWRKLFENNGQGPMIRKDIIPPDIAPLAKSDGTPGIVGVDNLTTKVNAQGIISTFEQYLPSSTYAQDEPLRIKAWAYVSQTPAILSGKNITSVSRVATGVIRVFSSFITTSSGVLAFGDNYSGGGGSYLRLSSTNYPLTDGQITIEARTVDGTLANNGRFTIIIL